MDFKNYKTYTDDITYTLLNFAGYGSVDSGIWFITFQQYLPSEFDLAAFVEIGQISSKEEFVSIWNKDDRFFDNHVLDGTGLALAKLILKLQQPRKTDFDQADYYQNHLLNSAGDSFLIPFYPIPIDTGRTCEFEDRFPLFKSYEDYLKKGKKLRGEFIQELLSQFAPKTLIALMSHDHFNNLIDVFPQFQFENHDGIFAGWDATTIMLLLDPAQALNDKLDKVAKFILDNSLPLDIKSNDSSNFSKGFVKSNQTSEQHERQKVRSKRKNKAKHDPSDPFCVCDECLRY